MTSLDALQPRTRAVLDEVPRDHEIGPDEMHAIARKLDLPMQAVAVRLAHLRDRGLVESRDLGKTIRDRAGQYVCGGVFWRRVGG